MSEAILPVSQNAMSSTGGRSEWTRWFWITLALTTLWKAIAIVKLNLCFDEGYYFYWSLFPQLSYFDHPPLTAWLMALSGWLFHNSVWTVRVWPFMGGILLAFMGRSLARRLFDAETGDRAGLLLLVSPLFIGNGFLMTPDAPFAVCWAAAVWCACRAVGSQPRFSVWWLAAGICAGLGFLAKYNMVLFFFGLGLYWLVSPGQRGAVFRGACVAGVIALLLFLPVLIWNERHDWISFRFQLGHGLSRNSRPMLANLGEYLGLLLLIFTPVLGVMCFWSAARRLAFKDPQRRLLAAFFWAVILFFGYSSLKTRVQANWPMLAFFSGLMLVARDWPAMARPWRRAALALVVALDVAGMAYLLLPAQFPLAWQGRSLDVPRMKEFIGAPEIARQVTATWRDTGSDFICPSSYQLFGSLAFYAPDLRPHLCLPAKGHLRFPWIDDSAWSGKTALLVSLSKPNPKNGAFFEQVTDWDAVDIPYKGTLRHRLLFQLGRGYSPAALPLSKDE
jgi:4-amino-4-deoxy-L-arabinose transferase-like glycosyltransferase